MGEFYEGPERRARPRVRVHIESELRTGGGQLVTGHTLDLSADGAFMTTPRSLPVGTAVRLTIRRGEARNPLIFDAAVVRVGDPREGRFSGLGLRFHGLTELDQGLLAAMLGQAVAA